MHFNSFCTSCLLNYVFYRFTVMLAPKMLLDTDIKMCPKWGRQCECFFTEELSLNARDCSPSVQGRLQIHEYVRVWGKVVERKLITVSSRQVADLAEGDSAAAQPALCVAVLLSHGQGPDCSRTLNSLSLPRRKVPEDTSMALSLWRPGLDPTPSRPLTGGCGRTRPSTQHYLLSLLVN